MPDEFRLLIAHSMRARRAGARGIMAGALLVFSPLAMGTILAQPTAATRADMIRAEDARGRGPEGVAPILAALRDPVLRTTAVRALGRLERPDLVRHIIPYLQDGTVRGTAADALVQALRGLPPAARRTAAERALLDSSFTLLRGRMSNEPDGSTRAVIARSIGRLPFNDPGQAREAEAALVGLVPAGSPNPPLATVEGVAHGLYSLARVRRSLGDLSNGAIEWLQLAAVFRPGTAGAERVRRPAWLALNAAGGVPIPVVSIGLGDPDAQVRRLAVAALPNVRDTQFVKASLERAARDPDFLVRLEWVRVYRQVSAAGNCRPLLAAMSDTVHHVRLAAIDALGGPCPERDSVLRALLQAIDQGPSRQATRDGWGVSWQARAHALAALARIDSGIARPLLTRDQRHPAWQVRMYVARGAAAIRDTVLLTSLAFDQVGSVREVALQGLSATLGHLADRVYVRALQSPDYHVVLAAARALKGAPLPDSALPAVIVALERITRENRQTSRDPRMELLARVREMGNRESAQRLLPLLNDVDEGIALEAAAVMNQLVEGERYSASRVQRAVSPLVPPNGQVRVRVTMSPGTGGGAFDVLLDADVAPMTVARVVKLIGQRYYDGLTFHRVVPNFVLQGGSPGMNEFVGDGPFLRDELGPEHHARYTLGISTRGRDTGDAQWFFNLVDNYRLDHEYTVAGRVVAGFEVIDRILEGDVMESVRIIPNR